MTKPLRNTRLVELTETHNLYLSFVRLAKIKGWNSEPMKRALYHAMLMSEQFQNSNLEKVRIALELP